MPSLAHRYIGTCVGPWTKHKYAYLLQFEKNGSVSGTCTGDEASALKVTKIYREFALTTQSCCGA